MAHRFPSHPLSLAVALLVGATGAGCNGQEDAGAAADPSGRQSAEEQVFDVSELGFDRGSEHATVRVIEFSDFGCVFCQSFHAETYPTIHEEFVETGKVVWKYIPVSLAGFPNADEAQLAGECAGEQDGFFEIKPLIYEHAQEWTEAARAEPVFVRLAGEAGLDQDAFATCLEGRVHMDRVEGNRRLASQIGIRGTPTFVVNGTPIQGAPPLEVFREALESELGEAEGPGRD